MSLFMVSRPVRRVFRPSIVGLSIAFAAVFAAACSDRNDVPTEPGFLHDFDPGPDDPGPLGTFPLPTPPGQVPGVDPESTGIVIPPGLPIKITVSGTLTFTPNPAYQQCAGNQGTLPPWSSLGPAGWSSAPNNYRVLVSIGRTGSPFGYNTSSPSADPVIAYINGGGGGPLWAARPSTYGFQCGQNPQLLLTGSQSVSAEILAPATVTPDRSTVVSGDTVTFTVSVPWTTTFVVNGGWTWVADSAGANPTVVSGCGMHDANCSYRIFGDGHAIAHTVHAENAVDLTGTSPTVHVAPGHLTLAADPTDIASGGFVTFTARRSDAKPVQVESWSWVPGSVSPTGPVGADCAGGDSICTTVLVNTSPADSTGVAQTGTMTAWAMMGTATESASVTVTVQRPTSIDTSGCGAAMTRLRAARLTALRTSSPVVQTALRSGNAPLKVLTCGGGGSGSPTMAFSANHDTLNWLYPRIRGELVNGLTIPERQPDTATVQVALRQWDGSPGSSGTPVTFTAYWLPEFGGHAHFTVPIDFGAMPHLPSGTPESGAPLTGYFFVSTTKKLPSFTDTTDGTGTVSAKLVAGYLGGRARVVASTVSLRMVDGFAILEILKDSLTIGYGVPGLIRLSDSVTSGVYWIGGTADHLQSDHFYVRAGLDTALRVIAESLHASANGKDYYPQYNDASLPTGGTFSVRQTGFDGRLFESPYGGQHTAGHTAHNTGLDIDIGLCLADAQGDGSDRVHRVSGTYVNTRTPQTICAGGGSLTTETIRVIAHNRIANFATLFNAIVRVHNDTANGNHFHIRFQ